MCVSSHRCATGDTQLTVFSCYGKIFRKKSRNLKCTGQSQKIIWVTVINMDLKSKDKLIRGDSFLFLFFSSLEFKVSLAHKKGSSNPWCLVLKKRHFLRFPWNPEVNPWHDLKATHNTFRVIVCTFETLFFRQSFSKELYLSFVFLRGHGNESCNIIDYWCGPYFPNSAHEYGTAWASRRLYL